MNPMDSRTGRRPRAQRMLGMRVPESLPAPEMNTTPLIDVMLVLLVMLILTVPLLTHTTTLDLPCAIPNASPPVAGIDVDIDFDGRLFCNGEAIPSIDALTPRFRVLAATNLHAPPLRVHADPRVAYGTVAQVLAAAQRTRVERIGLNPVRD
jgi:biopolymer transport protein ExbD